MHQRRGVPEAFHDRCHQEVAGRLDDIGRGRLRAQVIVPPERLEHGPDALEGRAGPRHRYQQAARDGRLGRAKDGRRQVGLSQLRMGRGQPQRQRVADRAHADVDETRHVRRDQAAFVEERRLERGVVADHGDDQLRLAGLRGARHRHHHVRNQRIHARARAVPADDFVAGAGQAPGHRLAHGPQADKADLHASLVRARINWARRPDWDRPSGRSARRPGPWRAWPAVARAAPAWRRSRRPPARP